MVFLFGGTLVLENSFAYPTVVMEVIQRERVTGFPGVPTLFALLLGMDLSAFDLSSLRYLTNTAGRRCLPAIFRHCGTSSIGPPFTPCMG